MNKYVVSIVSLLTLLSCGTSTTPTGVKTTPAETRIGNQTYSFVEKGTLAQSGETISGNGSIVFSTPLGSVKANRDFAFTLNLQDGGTVELITFASEKLESGAVVRFIRSGDKLKAGAPGHEIVLPKMDAKGPVSVIVAIHNSEAHYGIFPGNEKEFKHPIVHAHEGEEESIAFGKGKFWGLSLKNASVASIALPVESRFKH